MTTPSYWTDGYEERVAFKEVLAHRSNLRAREEAREEAVAEYMEIHGVDKARARAALFPLLGPTRSASVVHDALHGLGQGRGE